MAKLTVTVVVLLAFLVAAAAGTVFSDAGATATATTTMPAGLQQATRRSRFLLANSAVHTSPPHYAAGCKKLCKHDRSTCCGGRCVDLLSDEGNCGACGNRCNKKCINGFCDYAL